MLNDSITKVSKLPKIYTKENLPPQQKIVPEIFYIVNDKPVSREEYLRHNKNKK